MQEEIHISVTPSVRDGHAHQTWTTSGKVFIKKTATSKVMKVREALDILGNNN